ncbi:MAG: hypothetical protein ABGZ23_20005 [Fuerstiella sp.]
MDSWISPIFPYDFRRSLGVPENGRAEQSATDVEGTAELATHQSNVSCDTFLENF